MATTYLQILSGQVKSSHQARLYRQRAAHMSHMSAARRPAHYPHGRAMGFCIALNALLITDLNRQSLETTGYHPQISPEQARGNMIIIAHA